MTLGRRASVLAVGLALVGVAAACGSANPARHPGVAGGAGCSHGEAAVTGTRATIEAGDFFFSPACQTDAPSSSTITLVVHNAGQALHNVSVPDQNIDSDVEVGRTTIVTMKTGTTSIAFFCKYHRTSGMVGAIIPTGA